MSDSPTSNEEHGQEQDASGQPSEEFDDLYSVWCWLLFDCAPSSERNS